MKFSLNPASSILFSGVLLPSAIAFGRDKDLSLPTRFADMVTGHWTNENQSILKPNLFSLAMGDHCGVAVISKYLTVKNEAVLFQIGNESSTGRRVFMLNTL